MLTNEEKQRINDDVEIEGFRMDNEKIVKEDRELFSIKVYKMENTKFHYIPYKCAETIGKGPIRGSNFLWLWWMFCF